MNRRTFLTGMAAALGAIAIGAPEAADVHRNLVAVDLFAGGGGASQGIAEALGVAPIVAINHDPAAIAMHEANHPSTIHMHEDVFAVDPDDVVTDYTIDLLWLSPSCTHHSRAKGGTPRSEQLRSQPWVAVKWAEKRRPRVICLENVPEFETWGPLDAQGKPIASKKGATFKRFVAALRKLGYVVEWRVLNAADYGAPTSRKRLFMVARCDGDAIVWPEPTHGPTTDQPWRAAAVCIDWSVPIPSIFDRKRPLAEATQRRIAEGIRRYVLGGKPFLVNLTHGARVEDLDDPFRTITAAHRGEKAVVAPHLVNLSHGGRVEDIEQPANTITATPKGGDRVLVGATLINTRNGEREGQRPRALDITAPAPTVTAKGSQGAVVAAFMAKHNGSGEKWNAAVGRDLSEPTHTITGRDTSAIAAVTIESMYTNCRGSAIDAPLGTITAGGGGHHALVAAFLLKFYSSGGQWSDLDEPMHTLVTKARMGLVTVTIDGEEYAIVDIGMRMLTPRELARAQGFSDDYQLTGTKEQQIARLGNSVPPPVARAVVAANLNPSEEDLRKRRLRDRKRARRESERLAAK